MDTSGGAKKRNFSDLSDCSVGSPEHKRTNLNMEAPNVNRDLVESINSLKVQMEELLGLKTTCEQTQNAVQSIQSTLDSLSGQVKNTELKCQTILKDIVQKNRENVILKRRCVDLEEKYLKLECYSRRDNLIFEGITESKEENVEQKVRDFIKIHMKCKEVNKMKFVRVHRLGRPLLNKPRPVIAKFHYYPDRDVVWGKRKKLQGTGKWISEDFPVEIRNRRQVLLPIYLTAIKTPEFQKRTSFNADRLIIAGSVYTVNNLDQLPPALQLQNTSLKTTADSVFFYTRSSPLSNFFPSRFNLGGVEFSCVEQYYQLRKAEIHGDFKSANDIMTTSDPAAMHGIGNQVKAIQMSRQWTEGTQKLEMEKAVTAKFQQNKHLCDVLLSTKDKDLVEASPNDTFWGAGIPLRSIADVPKSEYPGQNELGKILSKVRQVLSP